MQLKVPFSMITGLKCTLFDRLTLVFIYSEFFCLNKCLIKQKNPEYIIKFKTVKNQFIKKYTFLYKVYKAA